MTITSPVDGNTLARKDVQIAGTITHVNDLETGVIVNGVTALVYGGQFVVNHVPLQSGTNTITVQAIDVNGAQYEKSITLFDTIPTRKITLSATVESGLTPLDATLKLDSNFVLTTSPVLSYYGPAEVTFFSSDEPDTWNIQINEPGIYSFDVEATDESGELYKDIVSVLAIDKNSLDSLLRAKWNGMKMALVSGDIENAEKYFTANRRSSYSWLFNNGSDQIGNLISKTGAIELLEATDGKARYVLEYEILIDNIPTAAGSYLIFILDVDGLWKIKFF